MKKLIFILMFMILFSGIINAAIIDNTLTYLNMDDAYTSGATAIDISGNTNATIAGASTGVTGILNEAYDGDGTDSDYVYFGSAMIPLTGDWSFNIWIYVSGTPSSTPDQIVNQYTCCSDAGRSQGGLDTAKKFVWAGGTTGVMASAALSDGWHMITVVRNYSGNAGLLYVDGASSANDTSYTSDVQNQATWLMRGSGLVDRGWPNAMDEFALWSRQLTREEISTIYNSGLGLSYPFIAASPPTNSSWNMTSANLASGGNRTVWNTGGLINVTTDLLSFTFTADVASNWTCSLTEGNYTQQLAASASNKLATTDTTSHAGTLFDSLSSGNDCVYCSGITSTGYETASGASSSGCLNVTLIPNNIVVTLNNPTDASTTKITSGDNVNFTFTPVFGGTLTNCSLYTNISGSFIVNVTNSSAITNNSVNGMVTGFNSATSVLWNYECCTSINCNMSVSNYTANIIIDAAPIVTLNKPSDSSSLLHYLYNTSGITFNFSAIENEGFDNCSLYTNSSGSWTLNQTNTSAITNNTNYNFDAINLSIGNYIWNVECCDNESQCSYAAANFSLQLNNTAPYWTSNISNTTVLEDFVSFTYLDNLSLYTADYDGDTIYYTVEAQNLSEVNCSVSQTGNAVTTTVWNYTGACNTDCGLAVDGNFSTYSYVGITQPYWYQNYTTTCSTPSVQSKGDDGDAGGAMQLWCMNATGWQQIYTTIGSTSAITREDVLPSGCIQNPVQTKITVNGGDFNTPHYYESQVLCGDGGSLTLTSVGNWTGNASCTIGINDTIVKGGNSTFWINVQNVNDGPYFNPALVDKSTNTSSTFGYDINCSDVDTGATITYYDNTTIFDINSATGIISQLVYEKYRGDNSIKITCGDGTLNATDSFTLEVNDTTDPRYVSSVATELNIDFCAESGTEVMNATFDDWYLSNGSTVYFSHNATGTFQNVSATFVSSLNSSRHTWQYSIPSLWSSAGFKHYRFIAIDNASNVNNSAMDITYFNISRNTTSTVLYLNNLSANRKYELSWGPNLTGTLTACTNETVWLDIGDPNYGVNYTSGTNSSVYYNYSITGITEFRFSNEDTTKNFTFVTEGNQSYEIQLPGKSAVTSAFLVINGTNYSTSYPNNVKIDTLNDSTYDVVLPGTLIGNMTNQSSFTTGSGSENLSFVLPGALIRYINVSSNSEGNDIGYNFPNITMNISGFAIDETGLDFYDYFDNASYAYRNNTCQGPLWIWDDFSKGDVTSRWDGDYTVLADTYIWNSVSAATCTPGTYSNCGTGCSNTDTEYFYSQTMNLKDTKLTKMRIRLVGYGRRNEAGSCISDPVCHSSAHAGIRDKTTTLLTTFISASTTTAGANYGTFTTDDIVEIKKEDGYLKWYSDGVLKGSLEYDSTHQYEVFTRQSGQYDRIWDGTSASCSAQAYIYPINKSGAVGNGTMDVYDNCSITYLALLNVSQSDNISKAIFDLDYDELGSGGTVSLFLSNNNGSTWETATDNIMHVFTSKGNVLTARINLTATGANTLLTNLTHISVIPGYITGLGIDIGYDGNNDYEYSGTLNVTNSPQKVEMETGDVKEYISDNCLGKPTCAIPIAFISTTSGNLQYSILNITQEFSRIYLNYSRMDDYLETITGDTNFSNSIHSTTGIVQLSGLDIDYKGGSNYSIKAHFEGNENYTTSSDTEYVAWRYSPVTTTYPAGVSYYNVYPTSVNAKNVGPFGQYIRNNESESVGIWNITTTAKEDPVKLYRWYNPSVDSCLTLSSCTYFNKSSCTDVTNTSSTTVARSGMVNDTEYKLYDFWNLTACDPSNLYLPGNFTFRSICQDCVRIW